MIQTDGYQGQQVWLMLMKSSKEKSEKSKRLTNILELLDVI